MIKISVIEDHSGFRKAMENLFGIAEGFQLINSFISADDALLKMTGIEDVILLDIQMPGTSGVDAIPFFKNKFPNTKIIILTMFDDNQNIMKAILNGANGYLLKKSSPEKIISAVNEVIAGGAPMNSTVATKVLNLFKKHIPKSNNDFSITKRELEILNLLVEGLENKAIAEKLFISLQTVRNHIRHIYEKLQVHSKSQAVVKAIREGLV